MLLTDGFTSKSYHLYGINLLHLEQIIYIIKTVGMYPSSIYETTIILIQN